MRKQAQILIVYLTVISSLQCMSGCKFSGLETTAVEQKLQESPLVLEEMSIEQLLPLAVKGDAEAQFQLGANYRRRAFFINAMHWHLRAAQQGHIRAQTNLAFMHYYGEGIDSDYAEAFRWFSAAAKKRDSIAQFMLASMYETGDGVAQDYANAFRYYAESAGQGNAASQCFLAYLYQSGQGVEKNMTKAVRWYLRSAEQDYTLAQNELAIIYYEGMGVKPDYAKAAKLFKKAAIAGDAWGQSNLSTYYLDAKAEPVDTVLAYAWLSIALETDKEVVDRELSDIETMMTESQIDEARRLADAWRPGQLLARD